jgi:dTDP-4-amino-4,6-dideoxygalactose transaminase
MKNIQSIRQIEFVDLERQYRSIRPDIDAAIRQVIDATDFVNGQAVKDFARAFATYCESEHCIPCGNGTDALEIGMKALGIGPGDEVIVPANSFIASSEAVNNIGAEVVFCDVDPDTFNIAPAKISEKITRRTKAIMPVHLYGRVADMQPILDIARQHGLFVVEDASQAHGARYRGRKAGNFGHFAVFSFYPGKNLGAYGDAGAIVTNDADLALRCRKIANHGRVAKYNHEIIGRNSRLDTLQAAILLAKLPHLAAWNIRRLEIANRYRQLLSEIPQVITPLDEPHETPVYHLFVVRIPSRHRYALQEFLKSKGIATGVHYPISLPKLEAYSYLNHLESDFSVANKYMDEILSLPIFAEMEDDEVRWVCACICEYFETNPD